MRRSAALILVLVLALAVTPLALASNGKGKAHKGHGKQAKTQTKAKAKGKNKFQLNGVVVPGDAVAGTLTVTVKAGSKTVKAFRGLPLTVTIAADARFVDSTADDATTTDPAAPPLTLADLVAGARVHLGGTIDRTDPANPVFVATKVIVQSLPQVVPTLAPEPTPTDSATPMAALIR